MVEARRVWHETHDAEKTIELIKRKSSIEGMIMNALARNCTHEKAIYRVNFMLFI